MDLPAHRMMNKRPGSVTTLMWLVFCLMVWNTIRLGASIANWKLLADFASRPGPMYIAASGFFWMMCGFGTLILLRKQHPGAHMAAVTLTTTYAIWWWVDRLFIQQGMQTNWPFNLALTIISLMLPAYLLFSRKTITYLNQKARNEEISSEPDNT